MNDITASTVAKFDASRNIGLSIEPDPGIYADGLVHLLVHPSDNDVALYASVGDVTRSDTTAVIVPSGAVQFNGTSKASLPKIPVYSSPSFHVQFAFDAKTGAPTTISLHYDAHRNVLSAGKDCIAAVAYSSYKSASRKIAYQPKRSQLGLGFVVEFGTITAFKPPNQIAVYAVPDENIIDDGFSTIELYRKFSKAIVIEEKSYEYPKKIENNQGTYTGPPESNPDKPLVLDLSSGYTVIERPHEIGYMDEWGRAYAFTPKIEIREPYSINDVYAPVIENRVARLDPEKYPANYILKAMDFLKSKGLKPPPLPPPPAPAS